MSHVVHLGDCLDPVSGLASLPDKSVDVTITDPPYSEHVHASTMRGAAGWKGEIAERSNLGFDSLDGRTLLSSAGELARVTRRWVAVFSDTESAHLWRGALEARGLEYVRTSFWHKVCGAPQFTGDRPAVAVEAITLCHQPGKKRWNGGGKQGLYSLPIAVGRPGRQQEDARVHTTQKPIALMEALVRDFTDAGETVLDPFAGSGTTGVACKRLGRNFIGWERDEKYHQIATKRIDGAREQLGLWTGAA